MKITSSDVKAVFQKVGAVIVVLALGIACFASTTGEVMKSEEYGKMIAVAAICDSSEVESVVEKVPYSSISDQMLEKDQLSHVEVAENENGKNILTGSGTVDEAAEQLKRDKAALQAILAADATDNNLIRQQAREQATKYQVNQITEAASVVFTEVKPGVPAVQRPSNPNPNQDFVPTTQGTPIYATPSQYGTYIGQYVCTAYCPCVICCEKTNGITASGELAVPNHTIATDSRFSFGTQLIIGNQIYTVEDRGGAIEGNRIDVFFNTHQEALVFGVQTFDIYYVK